MLGEYTNNLSESGIGLFNHFNNKMIEIMELRGMAPPSTKSSSARRY